MIQKKVCMVGAFATGKTSLVAQFVHSIYSEVYQTTVGVKIDKKLVQVGEETLTLILWDLHGEDDFQKLHLSYLRGSSGYFLVVDGTRRATLDKAYILQSKIEQEIGVTPFVLLLNKADLQDEWELEDEAIAEAIEQGWTVIKSSARTGLGVEEAFLTLSQKMLEV
jgi:small GTP-binding protein